MRVVENLSRGIHQEAQNIWQAVLKMSTGSGVVSLSKSAFRCELCKRWNGKTRLLVQLWENCDCADSRGEHSIRRDPLGDEYLGLESMHLRE
jgi:hypothetical protein